MFVFGYYNTVEVNMCNGILSPGLCVTKPSYMVFYNIPASIVYKSTTGRYRPVSYPDGPSIDLCRMLTGILQ